MSKQYSTSLGIENRHCITYIITTPYLKAPIWSTQYHCNCHLLFCSTKKWQKELKITTSFKKKPKTPHHVTPKKRSQPSNVCRSEEKLFKGGFARGVDHCGHRGRPAAAERVEIQPWEWVVSGKAVFGERSVFEKKNQGGLWLGSLCFFSVTFRKVGAFCFFLSAFAKQDLWFWRRIFGLWRIFPKSFPKAVAVLWEVFQKY